MRMITVRMWTKEGYHKDVAYLDDRQVRMCQQGMEASYRHLTHPLNAIRVVVDPKMFPEAVEFEVICERD